MTPGWWLTGLLLLAAQPVAAPPASPTAAWGGDWAGDWSGEGMAFGKPATATLAIAPAPDGKTAQLAYRLSIAGTPPIFYSAEASYRVDGKGWVSGSWTDSHGRTRPVGGRLYAREWVAHWGSADVEIGRSAYRLEGTEELTVSDSVLQDDGSWRVFATLRYRRQKP